MASASNASRATETNSSAGSSAGTGSGSNTRPSVDVTAITTRDDFLLELGQTLDGQKRDSSERASLPITTL